MLQVGLDCFRRIRGRCFFVTAGSSAFFDGSIDFGRLSSLAETIQPLAADAEHVDWSSTDAGSLSVSIRARQTTHRSGRMRSLIAVWIVRTKHRRQVTRWAHGNVCIVASADKHTTHCDTITFITLTDFSTLCTSLFNLSKWKYLYNVQSTKAFNIHESDSLGLSLTVVKERLEEIGFKMQWRR